MNAGAPLRIGMQAAPFHADVAHAPEGAEAFWLETLDGLRIRIALWRGGGRGTAFVFPGRTEYAEKYGLVAGRLVARGFSVVVIDWRGQGLSTRPPGAPMMGHVRSFPTINMTSPWRLPRRRRWRFPPRSCSSRIRWAAASRCARFWRPASSGPR